MCSIEDQFEKETNENFSQKSIIHIVNQKVCNKCRDQKPVIVLRNKDAYCKACFLKGTVHKFRAILGKHHFLKPNDYVLILHVGGHASSALLHFLRTCLDLPATQKFQCKPIILFLEHNYNLSLMERKEILIKVSKEVKQFHFPLYFVSLSEFILKDKSIKNDHNDVVISENDKFDLMNKIQDKASFTVKEEILKALKWQLLVDVARNLKCKYIFTTEIAIDIASQILTNVSLGRASQLPLDVGICDTRDPDINIIRPLRLYEIKELAIYNYLNDLEPVLIKKVTRNPYCSVQTLMREFVNNLQNNYSATVRTIVRTSDKLAMEKDATAHRICSICKGPIENSSGTITSSESTNFSRWLSTHSPNYFISPEERYTEAVASFNTLTNYCTHCFACNRIAEYIVNE